MTPELAARRLSAALGRKVAPEDIEEVFQEYVRLTSGQTVALLAGNAAYLGNGEYMKNGKAWPDAMHGDGPRSLSVD
jgi:hypothetical protein